MSSRLLSGRLARAALTGTVTPRDLLGEDGACAALIHELMDRLASQVADSDTRLRHDLSELEDELLPFVARSMGKPESAPSVKEDVRGFRSRMTRASLIREFFGVFRTFREASVREKVLSDRSDLFGALCGSARIEMRVDALRGLQGTSFEVDLSLPGLIPLDSFLERLPEGMAETALDHLAGAGVSTSSLLVVDGFMPGAKFERLILPEGRILHAVSSGTDLGADLGPEDGFLARQAAEAGRTGGRLAWGCGMVFPLGQLLSSFVRSGGEPMRDIRVLAVRPSLYRSMRRPEGTASPERSAGL